MVLQVDDVLVDGLIEELAGAGLGVEDAEDGFQRHHLIIFLEDDLQAASGGLILPVLVVLPC